MSRFRIFDKQEKKYVSEFLTQYYLNHDGKMFFVYAGEGNYNELHKELDPDRYIIEMSTGKEDFTGKMIYDGDIGIDQDEDAFTIEYDKEDAMFDVVYSTYSETFSVIDSKDLKVTGTIHDGEADGKK